MAFTPRTFDQIYTDAANYLLANPNIPANSLNDGSVLKTLLEAMALEDDEQYYQMVQLLNSFSIYNASGNLLDKRAAEYGVIRKDASYSTVNVYVQNAALAKTTLAIAAPAGSTTITVTSKTGFPVTPFNVFLDSGTSAIEQLTVSSVTTSGNNFIFNFSSPTSLSYSHLVGALITDASASPKNIPSGLRISTEASPGNPSITYVTTSVGYVGAGQFESGPIIAQSLNSGSVYRVGKGALVKFSGSTPFNGAVVTNKEAATGGMDTETDDDLRSRVISSIQSLSRGTVQTLKNGLIGVTDPNTSQQIRSTAVLEDTENKEVLIYIDDGSGFTPTTVNFGQTTLSTNATIGTGILSLTDMTVLPVAGYLLIKPDNLPFSELVKYLDYSGNLESVTTLGHSSGDVAQFVDVFLPSAEEAQHYTRTTFYPIQKNSFTLYKKHNTAITLLIEGVDYSINRGTGEIKIYGNGLSSGDSLFASYNYFIGLMATAYKVVEGDITNPTAYPGLKSAGIKVSIETPSTRQIPVTLTITVDNSSASSGIFDVVQANVRTIVEEYIQSLGIGGNFLLAEVYARVMQLSGVADVSVQYPTTNITILENELPTPYDSNGNSLITVQ